MGTETPNDIERAAIEAHAQRTVEQTALRKVRSRPCMQLPSRVEMSRVRSFAPIADARARVLILGSMPGKASLAAGQYYAHAQNLFWRILGEVIGAGAAFSALPYAARTRALKSRGIALWDVLASCEREGSLDADIDDATLNANAFAPFYRAHPRISHVFFNGAKAEAAYRKYVLATLVAGLGPQHYERLPSTSPANASMTHAYKKRVWQQALRPALAGNAHALVAGRESVAE